MRGFESKRHFAKKICILDVSHSYHMGRLVKPLSVCLLQDLPFPPAQTALALFYDRTLELPGVFMMESNL